MHAVSISLTTYQFHIYKIMDNDKVKYLLGLPQEGAPFYGRSFGSQGSNMMTNFCNSSWIIGGTDLGISHAFGVSIAFNSTRMH